MMPFGIVHAPASRSFQNGPPGCAMNTSSPAVFRRNSSRPALTFGRVVRGISSFRWVAERAEPCGGQLLPCASAVLPVATLARHVVEREDSPGPPLSRQPCGVEYDVEYDVEQNPDCRHARALD